MNAPALLVVAAVALSGCYTTTDTYTGVPATGPGYNSIAAQDYAGAARHYEGVLASDPSDPYALLNLGVAYERLGRTEDARAKYQAAAANGAHAYPDTQWVSTEQRGSMLDGHTSIAEIAHANLGMLDMATPAASAPVYYSPCAPTVYTYTPGCTTGW